ncbi:cbb3-type cytochrome c oxidase subunit I, partial [Bacillus mycoides]|uniref:cbb3-type cytochrome c oxidase subunit I n=1 Tax=Bacillus mycoides TaxID=1405 RepID=UPI003CC7E8B8
MTPINFLLTILKIPTPRITLIKIPMFTSSILITTIIIIFPFPVLTVPLPLITFHPLFDPHFFTIPSG